MAAAERAICNIHHHLIIGPYPVVISMVKGADDDNHNIKAF